HLRQQSYPTQPIIPTLGYGTVPVFQRALPFSDVEARSSESHTVLDFQVGRDIGVGLLGSGTRSTFNLGVRFAQFGSRSNVAFKSDPDAHPTFKYFPNGAKIVRGAIYHSNAAAESAIRNFHGVGPSIAWSASAGIAGTNEEGKILLDWGVNAAVLFGRQKAVVHHQTTALYHHGAYPQARSGYSYRSTLYRNAPPDRVRSHSVVVPNIGGFAGLSFRYDTAKVSFGYRGDFFFGAMDGGIDARKTYNRNFYGPFATVSIGLGG